MSNPYIITYSGKRFYPFAPRPEDVCIQDIAHALSNQCRFSGHTRCFFSVAEHSVLVSKECAEEDALLGLLHDAAEAYLQDMARPIKYSGNIQGYFEAEKIVEKAIATRFGLASLTKTPSVQMADARVYAAEVYVLMPKASWETTPIQKGDVNTDNLHISGWTPFFAKKKFLQRFEELTNGTYSSGI